MPHRTRQKGIGDWGTHQHTILLGTYVRQETVGDRHRKSRLKAKAHLAGILNIKMQEAKGRPHTARKTVETTPPGR